MAFTLDAGVLLVSSSGDNHLTTDRRSAEFTRLVMQYERQWKVYILSLVPSWADADDILQDTKLELWERFDEYDPTGDFGAWARKIIYYRVLTFRSQNSRERARFSRAAFELVAEEAANVAEETDLRLRLLAVCVQKLTDAARQLLYRCYAASATVKDVALELGRSVRGTQRSVAKIRVDLQRCVEREMRKEERT